MYYNFSETITKIFRNEFHFFKFRTGNKKDTKWEIEKRF